MRPICALLMAISLPVAAAESDSARARALYVEAQADLGQGRCDDAVPKQWQAYGLSPVPQALLHIGYCYRILGQFSKASDAYLRYLTAHPDHEDADHTPATDPLLETSEVADT